MATLIFCCADPTDPNFRQTVINNNTDFLYKRFFFIIYISCNLTFFCEITVIYEKQKFSERDIVEFWSIETWSISYVTSVDIIAQVSLTI